LLVVALPPSQDPVAGLSARPPESQESHDPAERVEPDEHFDDTAHLVP
jgi:hypothetical protein